MNRIGDFLNAIALAKDRLSDSLEKICFNKNHGKSFTRPFNNDEIAAPTCKNCRFFVCYCYVTNLSNLVNYHNLLVVLPQCLETANNKSPFNLNQSSNFRRRKSDATA